MGYSKVIKFDKFLAEITKYGNKPSLLMINPFVSDYRLPWAKWHQPAGLLQLGSFLEQHNVDVRLIDFLHSTKKQIVRRKNKTIAYGDYALTLWRFGLSSDVDLKNRIKKQLSNQWKPNAILLTSLNSIWWGDVKETIDTARELLPDTPVFLGGAYPRYNLDHAREHSGADFIVSNNIPEITRLRLNISLYQFPPKSIGIYFYYRDQNNQLVPRPSDEIINEIEEKIKLGVLEFVFLDDEIKLEDKFSFTNFLDLIISKGTKTKFVLQGNISAQTIDKNIAIKMKSAGIHKIYLKCNLDFDEKDYFTDLLDDYQQCMQYLIEDAKYHPRNDEIAAMLSIGIPFENLKTVTKRMIEVAHIVGSIIPVPFQYVSSDHQRFSFGSNKTLIEKFIEENIDSPEKFNSKLYPFAEISGYNFEEYIELTRLATLLNSKYRGATFDFLGNSFTAKRFRESLRTKGWNPFKDIKDSETISINELLLKNPEVKNDSSK